MVYPIAQELIARAQADGRLREDFTVADISLVALMVSGIADLTRDGASDLWRRVLVMLIDGIVDERAHPTPLPGPPPTPGELAGAVTHRGLP